jgi:hypothetical protein
MFKAKKKSAIEQIDLETAITTAVRKSSPNCEGFVGVVVGGCSPKSTDDSNWTVRGIKFGNAERESCNSALSLIVDRLKREFEISRR